MKKLFLIFLALPLLGQTTYTSSKYKPVWYSSTYEKTHGTYALFDTSSIKLQWTTSGKPEMKFFGPTGNTLFYLDSTGTISTGVITGGLLKANFDDSLNNAHTITGAWKFGGNVGAVPNGQVGVGKNAGNGYLKLMASDGDTISMYSNTSSSYLKSKNKIYFYNGASYFLFSGTSIVGVDGDLYLGDVTSRISDGFFKDGIWLGGHGSTPTFFLGSHDDITSQDDSCFTIEMSSGQPLVSYFASDGDSYTQSINTSDQAVFAGASGGYTFDSYGSFTGGVVINNTAVAPTAISGRMYFQGINNADADTLFFYNGTAWKQFISL
jgi:hypothetical protein